MTFRSTPSRLDPWGIVATGPGRDGRRVGPGWWADHEGMWGEPRVTDSSRQGRVRVGAAIAGPWPVDASWGSGGQARDGEDGVKVVSEWWPDWVGVRVVWARAGESVAWTAGVTGSFVRAVSEVLGAGNWTSVSQGSAWPADAAGQEAFVVAHAFDDGGGPVEGEGYSVGLLAESVETGALAYRLSVSAGAVTIRDHMLTHQAVLTTGKRGWDPARLSAEQADALIGAAIEIFDPLYVTVEDGRLLEFNMHGAWAVPVGYRVWLSDVVGRVQVVAPSVQARRVGTGTLLVVQQVDAQAAGAAMLETFDANGLSTVPH